MYHALELSMTHFIEMFVDVRHLQTQGFTLCTCCVVSVYS